MSAAAVIEELGAARAQLDSACELLTSPGADAFDRCAMLLESAGRQMTECQARIGEVRGDPVALEAAWRVRRSFLKAAKLLEGAAAFHGGWVAIRGVLTGGYTDRGEPAPVRHAGRICLEA